LKKKIFFVFPLFWRGGGGGKKKKKKTMAPFEGLSVRMGEETNCFLEEQRRAAFFGRYGGGGGKICRPGVFFFPKGGPFFIGVWRVSLEQKKGGRANLADGMESD